MRHRLLLLTLLGVATGVLQAQQGKGTVSGTVVEMSPFSLDWHTSGKSLLDLSFLLDTPAGRDGFIRVTNGHLVKPNGERFRIWGTNFTGPANLPPKADAPAIAALLAEFGLNCVRFHMLDQPAPRGLLDATRNDTRAFDPRQLDRLDFFIAELKKRGIYSDLNLDVGRVYKQGDGVRDYEYIAYAKGLTYFDKRLLKLQREYAKELLTHYNPYTRSEYRSEPAIAIVEIVNENSLINEWLRGRLIGKNTQEHPDTWTDITAGYEQELTRKFQSWLASNGYPAVPRLKPLEFAGAPTERFRREAAFYMEMEDRYFRSMHHYLKDDLGVNALIVGTSDFDQSVSGYATLRSVSSLDVVDAHTYWQHPRYTTEWGGAFGFRRGFEISNTPMVNVPQDSTVVRLSRSAVAGKPFIVSEVNHPFPSEYACEGIPILAAYAAFQDWDGVFWYNFESIDSSQWQPSVRLWFNIRADPVKMAQLASGALTFLRGDVAQAQKTVARTYTPEQVLESLRLPRGEAPYFTPGFSPLIPLLHATRIGGFEGPATEKTSWPGDWSSIVSDTGELRWSNSGVVAVNAARTQSLIGYCARYPTMLRNLSAKVGNQFAAITLVSMDGADLSQSHKMLLVAGARIANSGMKWNAAHTALEDWGSAPTLIEPVAGTVTLKNLMKAKAVEVVPLDGSGRPLDEAVSATRTSSGWQIEIGPPPTVWYLIRVSE